MRPQKSRAIIAVVGSVVTVSSILSGCGSDNASNSSSASETSASGASGTTAKGTHNITVSMSEWTMEAPATVPAGTVTIDAVNDGGKPHEILVVRAESSKGFVVDETGKVDEDKFAEGTLLGEIEEFEAGTSKSGTFDLSPGTYVLFCNIVEKQPDGSYESHFLKKMESTITVGS